MRFNVSQLLKAAVATSRQHELEEDISAIDPDLEPIAPLVGMVRFLRTTDGILVTGRLHTEVRVPCRRCLQGFCHSIDLSLEEEFRPSLDVNTGAALPPEDGEDSVTVVDSHHMLDLTEVVRQNLVLATPMSPLCDPRCRGLCPHCGANLNTEPCACSDQKGDPRLAVLRQWS